MKLEIKDIKEKLSLEKLNNFSIGFLLQKARLFPIIVLVISLFWGMYLWYVYVLHPSWPQERKDEYIRSKSLEVNFDNKKFREVVAESEKREEEYARKPEKSRDIFRLKEASPAPTPEAEEKKAEEIKPVTQEKNIAPTP